MRKTFHELSWKRSSPTQFVKWKDGWEGMKRGLFAGCRIRRTTRYYEDEDEGSLIKQESAHESTF